MRSWKWVFIFLLLALSLVTIFVFQIPDSNLHLIACDVGQGDATLIIHKNYQVLIDGGPDTKVLDCLGRYVPVWDRKIELLILTHPDKDHFQGLIDVVRRYNIDTYLLNPITIGKQEYKVLEKEVGSRHVRELYPHTGQVLRVGMIQLDTFAPIDLEISEVIASDRGKEVSEGETNRLSIVSLVSFGKFRALLTGDMVNTTSDDLAAGGTIGTVNYIKIPHHGSKNGATINLLKAIKPKVAVISVGKNNIYGHPAEEITKMLDELKIKTMRTDLNGDIEMVTDGDRYWIRN